MPLQLLGTPRITGGGILGKIPDTIGQGQVIQRIADRSATKPAPQAAGQQYTPPQIRPDIEGGGGTGGVTGGPPPGTTGQDGTGRQPLLGQDTSQPGWQPGELMNIGREMGAAGREFFSPDYNRAQHEAMQNWWGQGLNELDPNLTAQMGDQFTEWDMFGPAGARYDYPEQTSMDRMLAMQDPNAVAAQLGSQAIGFRGQLEGLQAQDPLQQAVRARMFAGAMGGDVTDPNSPAGQYYQRLKEQMDIEASEQKRGIEKQLAANRGLYGSKHVGALSDLARKQTADRNAKLAELTLQSQKEATNFLLQDEGLKNQFTQIGAQLASQGFGNAQQAQQALLGHVGNMTSQANQQAALKLDTFKNDFAQKLAKVQNVADMSKFIKQFDAEYQNMMWDNLMDLGNLVVGGINDWRSSRQQGAGQAIGQYAQLFM